MPRAPPRLTVIGAAGLPLRADKTGQPLRMAKKCFTDILSYFTCFLHRKNTNADYNLGIKKKNRKRGIRDG